MANGVNGKPDLKYQIAIPKPPCSIYVEINSDVLSKYVPTDDPAWRATHGTSPKTLRCFVSEKNIVGLGGCERNVDWITRGFPS